MCLISKILPSGQWTNDHRIKWNEASILATENHQLSRKMRESIEIEIKA